MISVILDTNVLVSAFLIGGSVPDKVLRRCLDSDCKLIFSEATMDELVEKLKKPKI